MTDDVDHAMQLFRTHFWPLYPEEAKRDLSRARREDANPGGNRALGEAPARIADAFRKLAPELFGEDLDLDFSDGSVHRLSRALDPERLRRWLGAGEPGTEANMAAMLALHGTAYVGECVVRAHGGRWLLRNPLWESRVLLESHAGQAELAIFQWWLKTLAAAAGDASTVTAGVGLAERYRTHVEEPCRDVDAEPILNPSPSSVPRLKKPRYDTLHRLLKAHAPMIRELGADFPSAERFSELELRWIDAHWVGGGRRLLLAGAAKSGLHLFWLGAEGFMKGAFFVTDEFPDPVVRLDGERVVLLFRHQNADQNVELLWWGP